MVTVLMVIGLMVIGLKVIGLKVIGLKVIGLKVIALMVIVRMVIVRMVIVRMVIVAIVIVLVVVVLFIVVFILILAYQKYEYPFKRTLRHIFKTYKSVVGLSRTVDRNGFIAQNVSVLVFSHCRDIRIMVFSSVGMEVPITVMVCCGLQSLVTCNR
jgi:hypothetical protein